MASKAPALVQRYVANGDLSLRDWHVLLRKVTFGAALVLMSASIVSLHWACNLIGLRGYWEPVAWVVPLAMETGMAAVASTATTIRKDPKPGQEDRPGGYYISLWVIFSFVMLLAQASNIGHAVVTIADNHEIPPVIPMGAVYFFACAFAALFPLGGTMFVHVSGFLRAHGTGAKWIDQDAEVVFEQAAPGTATAPAKKTAKKPDTKPAEVEATRTAPATESAPAREQAPARTPEPTRQSAQRTALRPAAERVVAAVQEKIAAGATKKPSAKDIYQDLGLTAEDLSESQARRIVQGEWNRHLAELEGAQDPIVEQVQADEARAHDEGDAREQGPVLRTA